MSHLSETTEETLSNEAEEIPLAINGEVVDCPEMVPLIDGEPAVNNNAMPLDPASNSFYPQSSMYPYYPMVFTPQQLPPNTSIIPLAGEYSIYLPTELNSSQRSNRTVSFLAIA